MTNAPALVVSAPPTTSASDFPDAAASRNYTEKFAAVMLQCRVNEVPAWIGVLINHWLAFAVALTVPTILAGLFGWIVFRRGIKGVYFSLITQALLLMTFTLVRAMRPYTGGVDGLTS